MMSRRWLVFIALGLLLGCKPELQRVIVSGKVTYQGQPVADGSILLVPVKGTKGPQAGAQITDGLYRVTAGGGVPMGTHHVEIRAYRPASGAKRPAPLQDRQGKQQYLPEEYNDKSTLEATVDRGGEQTQDFDLK